jgi:transposase
MEQCTLEQRVFLYDTYVKYGSAGKCRRKFRRKFRDERVSSIQTIHNLLNKLRTMGLLIDKKAKHKRRALTEEFHDIGARLEHTRTPTKSLKRLAQETGVSKSSATMAAQLLKPSSESWCLLCCKCKKDCCTCVFNETINCEKYLRVETHRKCYPVQGYCPWSILWHRASLWQNLIRHDNTSCWKAWYRARDMQLDLCYAGKQEYKCYIVWRDPQSVRREGCSLLCCEAWSWMILFGGSTIMATIQ